MILSPPPFKTSPYRCRIGANIGGFFHTTRLCPQSLGIHRSLMPSENTPAVPSVFLRQSRCSVRRHGHTNFI